jgi:hypothetical protein
MNRLDNNFVSLTHSSAADAQPSGKLYGVAQTFSQIFSKPASVRTAITAGTALTVFGAALAVLRSFSCNEECLGKIEFIDPQPNPNASSSLGFSYANHTLNYNFEPDLTAASQIVSQTNHSNVPFTATLEVPGNQTSVIVAQVNSTFASTAAVLLNATSQEVSNATSEAVLNATSQTVLNAISEAVLNATSQEVLSATSEAVLNATSQTVLNATSEAVLNATSQTVLNATSEAVSILFEMCPTAGNSTPINKENAGIIPPDQSEAETATHTVKEKPPQSRYYLNWKEQLLGNQDRDQNKAHKPVCYQEAAATNGKSICIVNVKN